MQIFNLTFVFIFGLLIGSFLNCLIWRLYKKESILGRSYCPKCKKQIDWYDNIPILSFLFLKGKCRHCKNKISLQYPIVELATGILFTISFIYNFSIQSFLENEIVFNFQNYKLLIAIIRDWIIISVMIIVFIYDLKWYLILDIVMLPAIIILFVINIILNYSWFWLLAFGVIGASFFLVQFLVSSGRWVGGGDIRLGFLIGLIFGRLDMLILCFLLAYFIGTIIGVGFIIFGKKKMNSKMPLGVFLSTATIISLFFGQTILNWYFGYF